jgi:neural cell adhesion molecule
LHVEAVQGTIARLPCNLTTQNDADRVSLVIWYKEGQSTPIYSFDVRHTEALEKGLHHEGTGVLNGRSHFNTTLLPSFVITNVKGQDNGLYRCRVDFIKSPTRNTKIQLSVIGETLDDNDVNVSQSLYVYTV